VELAHTLYEDHLQAIYQLKEQYNKNKKEFKRHFLNRSELSPTDMNGSSKGDKSSVTNLKLSARKSSTTNQDQTPHQRQKSMRKLDGLHTNRFVTPMFPENEKEEDLSHIELQLHEHETDTDQDMEQLIKEKTPDKSVMDEELFKEALTIENYYHMEGLRMSKDIENRLRHILQEAANGKEIKLYGHNPPQLHEILQVDYQTISHARQNMQKLQTALEEYQNGAKRNDEPDDYANDSVEIFKARYGSA
jgi:hypothetical protein